MNLYYRDISNIYYIKVFFLYNIKLCILRYNCEIF